MVWFDQDRGRAHYYKVTSALTQQIRESLWWFMVKNESYRYKHDQREIDKSKPNFINNSLIDLKIGEVVNSFVE